MVWGFQLITSIERPSRLCWQFGYCVLCTWQGAGGWRLDCPEWSIWGDHGWGWGGTAESLWGYWHEQPPGGVHHTLQQSEQQSMSTTHTTCTAMLELHWTSGPNSGVSVQKAQGTFDHVQFIAPLKLCFRAFSRGLCYQNTWWTCRDVIFPD